MPFCNAPPLLTPVPLIVNGLGLRTVWLFRFSIAPLVTTMLLAALPNPMELPSCTVPAAIVNVVALLPTLFAAFRLSVPTPTLVRLKFPLSMPLTEVLVALRVRLPSPPMLLSLAMTTVLLTMPVPVLLISAPPLLMPVPLIVTEALFTVWPFRSSTAPVPVTLTAPVVRPSAVAWPSFKVPADTVVFPA